MNMMNRKAFLMVHVEHAKKKEIVAMIQAIVQTAIKPFFNHSI